MPGTMAEWPCCRGEKEGIAIYFITIDFMLTLSETNVVCDIVMSFVIL